MVFYWWGVLGELRGELDVSGRSEACSILQLKHPSSNYTVGEENLDNVSYMATPVISRAKWCG